MAELPIIDVRPLSGGASDAEETARSIGAACRDVGFFYVTGHGVPRQPLRHLETASRAFFDLPLERKMEIRMELGGRAWRGYFPVGDELTGGRPDQKEGIYFGAELDDDHPRVAAGTPLHGRNLFPSEPRELRHCVLSYIAAMTELGQQVMAGIALSLGLERSHFAQTLTREPTVLFRIFNYPPLSGESTAQLWGVGEHTDYGLLTLLLQDDTGGLEVKTGGRFVEAPPVPDAFVCNLGDMLERMTGGRYRSTPHRVRNRSRRQRLSFPFFFDPGWDADLTPLPGSIPANDDRESRWDGRSVHAFEGSYGDYLLAKVSKVFPDLGAREL